MHRFCLFEELAAHVIIINMKLVIPAWRTIRLYLVFGLVLAIFFYMIPGLTFPPTSAHYIIISIWTLTTIVYTFIGVKTNYYIIEKNGILHHRFNKEFIHNYSDIVYIDEEYTLKHKTLRFVTKTGQIYYLLFDRDGKIYQLVKKHASLLNEDEFKSRYSHIKL